MFVNMKRFFVTFFFVLLIASTSTFAVSIQAKRSKPHYELADTMGTFLEVPFYFQEDSYYCGPACLQMVFDYYGETISQREIAGVARTVGAPEYSTYSDELRRAGHFSNVSTSTGMELPQPITGYSLRSLGYASFESYYMDLQTLKGFIDRGKPLILLMWYSGDYENGHYRVATGYNQTHVFLHDPYYMPPYMGPYTAFGNSLFLDLWSYSGNWAQYVCPWEVTISAPSSIEPGKSFQVVSNVTYPQAVPNAMSDYPASSCNATIVLPEGVSLAPSETEKKTLGSGSLNAGTSATAGWTLISNSSAPGPVRIIAEGKVFGSVGPGYGYPPYDYSDRIGVSKLCAFNIHDIAVLGIQRGKTIVGEAGTCELYVTAINQGAYIESFNLTVWAIIAPPQINIQTILVTSLPSCESRTIAFRWNTSAWAYGNYTLGATAAPITDEINMENNIFSGSWVMVTIPGDVKGDRIVNVLDLISVANHLGHTSGDGHTPFTPDWYKCMNTDIKEDGAHNVLDLILCANHLGEHWL